MPDERRLSSGDLQLVVRRSRESVRALQQAEDMDKAREWREARWRPRSLDNRFGIDLGPLHDVGFIVGPRGTEQELITCHKIMLARCSEVFAVMFYSGAEVFTYDDEAPLLVPDILPRAFDIMVDYVYSGQLSLERFDVACSLLHAAKKYRLPELETKSRAFVWSRIYPGNVWAALQDFKDLEEERPLYETALQILRLKTSKLLERRNFEKVPLELLVLLLQQDQLNVQSEMELYCACVRWARAEALRRGLDQEPSTLRELLGPALKHLRFLALNPDDLGEIGDENLGDTVTEVLEDSLNESGDLMVRYRTSPLPPTFFAVGLRDECFDQHIEEEYFENTYDVFSQAFSSSGDFESTQLGIQIPTQVKPKDCMDDCYEEDLTIVFYDFSARKLLSITNFTDRVKYDSIIDIPFKEKIRLDSKRIRKVVKVIFHKNGTYPLRYIALNGPDCNELQTEATFCDTEDVMLWHKKTFSFIRFCAYTVDSKMAEP